MINVRKDVHKVIKVDRKSFINSFFAKQKETAGLIAAGVKEREIEIRKMLGFDKHDELIDKIDKMIETTKNAAVTLSGFLLGAEVVIEYKEQIETLGADLKAKAETVAALKLDLNGKQVIKTERASVNSLDKKTNPSYQVGDFNNSNRKTSIKNTEDLLVSYEKKINELETLAAEIAVERHVIDEYDQINKLIENLNTSKKFKDKI